MEKILFVVALVVISMIHSWLQKRKGEPEEDSSPWPGTPPRRPNAPPMSRPAPPVSPAGSWEDELRRLLQGDEPADSRPPVVSQPPPLAVPPPMPRPVPPRSRATPSPEPVTDTGGDSDVGLPVQMPTLERSAQAFLRASNLETRVAEHMRGVDAKVTSHVVAEIKRQKSPDIRNAVAMVRNPQSQRTAILTGVILGPPKALES